MNWPERIIVSDKSSNLIFDNPSPTQLKSKGKGFNSGILTVVDNILTDVTIEDIRGSSSRGSSTVNFEVRCNIGRAPNQVSQVLYIESDDMLRLMRNNVVDKGVLLGDYTVTFSGLVYSIVAYTDELRVKQQQKERLQADKKQEELLRRKDLRDTNRMVLSRLYKGDYVQVDGMDVVYGGEGYVTYLRVTGDDYSTITKKGYIVLGSRTYLDRGILTPALLDISKVEVLPSTRTGSFDINQYMEEHQRVMYSGLIYRQYPNLLVSQKLHYINAILASIQTTKGYSEAQFEEYRDSINYGNRDLDSFWEGVPAIALYNKKMSLTIDNLGGAYYAT